MYNDLDLSDILFLDIETVSAEATLSELSQDLQIAWEDKAKKIMKGEEHDSSEVFTQKAAIFAEFGRIVCISVGFIQQTSEGRMLRIKSFADPDERIVLEDFKDLLHKSPQLRKFCGHNIREFDIPYIGRRMLINQISLPKLLDLRGKKPWETKHLLDTMEMWSFGDRKNYTSLKLLAAVFGVPSPKDDISGADVTRVFWEDGELDRITKYCEKDVAATTNVFLSLIQQDKIPESNITFVGRT